MANAGVEKGDRLNQSFDMRIARAVNAELQPARYFSEFLGEVGPQAGKKLQLALVIRQQFVAHDRSFGLTEILPEAVSSVLLNRTRSRSDSTYNTASI